MDFINQDCLVAWAAGLFDGEGTILINEHGIRVCLHMTDLDILETMKSNFGGSLIPCKKAKDHYKDSWKWYLSNNKDTCDFLKIILPFLHSRRKDKAAQAISAYKILNDKNISESNRVNLLRDKIKILAQNGLKHREIALIVKTSRSYVTHILNGRYK